MADWKLQQMVKASGWPLAADVFTPGTDFNAPVDGGLVPLHWACRQGKVGLLKLMLELGANVQDHTERGESMLALATESQSFQAVMMLIDRLKALAAPPPDDALRQRLTRTFGQGHVNAKNRLQQTLKDWDRIARQSPAPGALPPR